MTIEGEKRRVSPDSLPSPKRIEIELCSPHGSDQDVLSREEVDSVDHLTTDQDDQGVSMEEVDSVGDPLTYYREVLWSLIDDDDLRLIADKVINCGVDIVETIKDFLKTLPPCSDSKITNQEALQHFDTVKSLWGNKQLLLALTKMHGFLPDLNTYAEVSNLRLSRYLAAKIRSDPSFKEDIFEFKDKSTTMRNALSILIGYWSNEDMISLMLSIGGPSLSSSLKVVKVDDAFLPWGEEVVSGEISTPIEDCSPIEDLCNDSSINELADQLLKIEEAFSLANNYLAALKGDGDTTSYKYHLNHYFAASNFWVDSAIQVPLIKALQKSKSLFGIFKKYSKYAQCLRCVDRLTRIQKDSDLGRVCVDGDPVQMTRQALCVLFGYWIDYDVRSLHHKLYHVRSGLKEGLDGIKVVEYFRRSLGDFEGLRNVLEKKYSRDSEEYLGLFETIKEAQQRKEQTPNHIVRILNVPSIPVRPAAIIKVLLQNSDVVWMEVLGL